MNNNKRHIKLENVNSSHLDRKITSVWMKISLISFCFRFWKATYQPRPERLHFILGRRLIVSICFNLVQPSYKVHIRWFHDGYSCFDFASEVKDGEESEGKVVGNKGSRIPATLKEDLPSAELKRRRVCKLSCIERERTYEAYYDTTNSGVPCCIWLEVRSVRKCTAIKALCLESLVKADISDRDAKPRHQPRDGGHIGEPTENFSRARLDTHVR